MRNLPENRVQKVDGITPVLFAPVDRSLDNLFARVGTKRISDLDPRTAQKELERLLASHPRQRHRAYSVSIERELPLGAISWNTHTVFAGDAAQALLTAITSERAKGYDLTGNWRCVEC